MVEICDPQDKTTSVNGRGNSLWLDANALSRVEANPDHYHSSRLRHAEKLNMPSTVSPSDPSRLTTM